MAKDELRLYGDPLRLDPDSIRLRQFLAQALTRGLSCALCMTGVKGDRTGRPVALSNGARTFAVLTRLPPAELEMVLAAADQAVASTAPVVVFGSEQVCRQAGLEFPDACWLSPCQEGQEQTLLEQVLGFLEGAAREDPQPGLSREELGPLFALPPPLPGGCVLHLGSLSPARGTDLAIEAFAGARTSEPGRLLVFLESRDPEQERRWLEQAGPVGGQAEIGFCSGRPGLEDLRQATAVLQPSRAFMADDWPWLLQALASGRPLVASRFSASMQLLGAKGICHPIGGVVLAGMSPEGGGFEPDSRTVVHALEKVLGGESDAAMGQRARQRVASHHTTGRVRMPAVEPEPRGGKPLVVFEAPLLETSSSSHLTLETARALLRRGGVELRLVPRVPFEASLGELEAEYPDLSPLLCRQPARADFWLSAGWPPRLDRPRANCFGLRLDWEYGALPAELAPAVTQEADRVVVHSKAVQRTLVAAGRKPSEISLIPHGIDGSVFHPDAGALAEVLAFKGRRRAILFVGGLIWRKGIDLLLKALLDSYGREDPVCLVVKPLGSESSYAGHNLDELVARVQQFSEAPEILVLDRRLSKEEMAGLYRACDVFFHPYRGEGFCLPALEARACGLPLVITEGGSTDDFCQGDSCLRIPSHRRQVALPGPHIGNPFVLEPDSSATSLFLRQALLHLESLQQVARQEATAVIETYTWDRAAAQIEELAYAAVEGPCTLPRLPYDTHGDSPHRHPSPLLLHRQVP